MAPMDDMGAEPGCGDGDDYEDLAGIFWSAEVDQVIRRIVRTGARQRAITFSNQSGSVGNSAYGWQLTEERTGNLPRVSRSAA